MCVKLFPENLNFGPYSLTPHKHLYLWSDYRTKSAQQ